MASTNQSPFYKAAEKKFLSSQTDKQRLEALEEMIRECPKHKSSEKMLANLKKRYIKLKEKLETERNKKSSKRGKIGIKKEEMQAVIVGFANSGKSSLLANLTNAKTNISEYQFSTKTPLVGIMEIYGTGIQIIDIPAIESEYYDKGIVHTADVVIILVDNLNQIMEIKKQLGNINAKQIIVFNKIDNLSESEKRKITATLESRKYNFSLISTITKEGFEDLKEKIFNSFGKIRIYTKHPGKVIEKINKPIIMEPESTVKDVAEKILKGFSQKVKETKIWGPSSKFSGQKVGMTHQVKDMDIVEFKTT